MFLVYSKKNEWKRDSFLLPALVGAGKESAFRVVNDFDENVFVFTKSRKKDGDSSQYQYLTRLPADVLAYLATGKGCLVIDASNEGPSFTKKNVEAFYSMMAQLGVDPASVIFLTQNVLMAGQLDLCCAELNQQRKPHVFEYHYFLRDLINYVKFNEAVNLELDKRYRFFVGRQVADIQKHYFCMNFTPRGHRLALMLWLIQKELLDRGFVSFSGFVNRKMDISERVDEMLKRSGFSNYGQLLEFVPALEAKGSMTIDADPFGKSPVTNIGPSDCFNHSVFSIVTESGVTSEGFRRFTEKVFKPVLGLHPFCVVGLPHTLAEFKRFGFETFPEFFDESYDQVKDTPQRIDIVLANIERLANLSHVELIGELDKTKDALLHNFEHFRYGVEARFEAILETPLLNFLDNFFTKHD